MGTDGERAQYILRPAQRRYLPVKRALDILVSLALLFLLAVPMLAVALIQKLTGPAGPVIFQQQRVGRNGELFTMLKFRTMGTVPAGKGTPERAARLSRFLRASSIDELPQLFLVLTGKMSLIGPRPLVPQEETVHVLRWAAGVYQLRPDITGWAQINGRDMVPDEAKAALDREYLENMRFGLDWKIFWRTIGKVAGRDGVLDRSERDLRR